MTQQNLNLGTVPNDDTGDPLRTAGQKIQDNFTELYSASATKAPLASPALTGIPTAPTAAASTNTTQIATTAMVQAALAAYIAAQDVLVFKGVVDCSANPNYPAADAGAVYKVSVAGKIGGVSGPNVEIGDVLTCVVDSSASDTHANVGAKWVISQVNIDGAVTGPTSATDARIAVFDGTTGNLLKDGGSTIADLTSGATDIASAIHAAPGKTTPVDADEIGIVDSEASNGLKNLTWANLKAALPSATDLSNVSFAVSASAGALTIALKDAAGNDPSAASPVALKFRDPNGTTGTLSQLSITAAASLVIPSSGTMGVTSATAFRLWIVGFNDGGTFRLGVINCAGANNIYPLYESDPVSSTAISGSSNSSGVFYTGTAVTTKSYRILGFIEWNTTGLTAGTWTTTNLTRVRTFGPGMKKPGEVVQCVLSSGGSTLNPSTTTFTDITGSAFSFTMRSPANRVFVTYTGQTSATAGGAGINTEATVAIAFGGVQFGSPQNVVGVVSGGGTNMKTDGAVSLSLLTFLNSTSANLVCQHKGLNTSGTVVSAVTGFAQEIMA